MRQLIQPSSELLLKFLNNLCSHGQGQVLTLFESRKDQLQGEERLIKMKSPGPIVSLWQAAAELEKRLSAAWPNSGCLLGWMIKPSMTFSNVEDYKSSCGAEKPRSDRRTLQFLKWKLKYSFILEKE